MSLFRSNSCAAVTWDNDGRCYGLRVDRKSGVPTVVSHHVTTRLSSQSYADAVAATLAELPRDEDTLVVIGGNGMRAAVADIRMPRLAPADMRSALPFQLERHSPMPLHDMQWGYRVIERDSDQDVVRACYFPQDEWNDWLAGGSAVPGGVDRIIPALEAIDPVLSDLDVGIASGNGAPGYVFSRNADGTRAVTLADDAGAGGAVYGLGESPLADCELELGTLAAEDADIQQGFAQAGILCLYGLSDAFVQDSATWQPAPLELPRELVRKRNQLAKGTCLALALVIVALLGFLVTRHVYALHIELSYMAKARVELEQRVAAAPVVAVDEEFLDNLEVDLQEARELVQPLSRALIVVTSLTDDQLWSTSFKWTDSNMSVELRADGETAPAGFDSFIESPYLANVLPEKQQPGVFTIKCRLRDDGEIASAGGIEALLLPEPEPEPEPEEQGDEAYEDEELEEEVEEGEEAGEDDESAEEPEEDAVDEEEDDGGQE
jgi:hypothetical protein